MVVSLRRAPGVEARRDAMRPSDRDYPRAGDRLRNRRMRAKQGYSDSPDNGLTMNRWAVAGSATTVMIIRFSARVLLDMTTWCVL